MRSIDFAFQIYIMLCLNFDFYIIPLTLLLTFLKQYVMCMLLADRNVNPEEQVRAYSYSAVFEKMWNLSHVFSGLFLLK